MAGAKDIVMQQLQNGQFLIDKFTADLTDAEYFKPPVEASNHVGWVLGHVACSEDWVLSLLSRSKYHLPQTTHDLFKGGSKCLADAAKYPARKAIDELFRAMRGRVVEALKKSDESTWGAPSPEGAPRDFFPTVGSMWALQGTHQYWHIGQLTVCRQAMKKKNVLF